MVNLSIRAEVYCLDGLVGTSIYLVGNPDIHQLTHLVVKTYLPPFDEYLVPVDQVKETTPNKIKLKCTRNDLHKMEPFVVESYIQTELPGYLVWSSVPPIPGYTMEPVTTHIKVRCQNIQQGELALHRGARVQATDGFIGQVNELLINLSNMQVTHLVLRERYILTKREIAIPISQIDHVEADTVYLKLDRQSVETFSTTSKLHEPKYKKDSKFERRKMIDNMLVVVFDSENKAYEGSKALQELQNERHINFNLYAKAVIVRDASGKLTVTQQSNIGPAGTAVGLLTGSLIGLIGGPLGVVLGAGAGMFGGSLYDLEHLGVGEDFIAEAEKSLLPGKAAVVAEVWEEWTFPVDTRMEALGGKVIRSTRREFDGAQIESEVAALNAELYKLEDEFKHAIGESRLKLQKKIDSAKGKLQAMQDDIQAVLESSQKETEAKIKSLQQQADKESDERKAKRKARIAELKADQKQRSEHLKQAWDHIKQALSM